MTDPSSKADLRRTFLQRRKEIPEDIRRDCALKTAELFFKDITLPKGAVVSGYWPMNGEMDDLPILRELIKRGYRCALPHVVSEGEPLRFLSWDENAPMVTGKYGIREPATHRIVVPDIILVPMLAFDTKGHRLGYGGGFYDRTLCDFSVQAVGLAYETQFSEVLPVEENDAHLDMVVTEKNIYRFGA